MARLSKQSGQTLVETLVAVFILSMGMTAAAGLANFAFSSSTNIVKQIIAIGLARQGIEAVKNMRDINWLNSQPGGGGFVGTPTSDCYNFLTGQNTATCYKDWLTAIYNLNPPSGNFGDSYTLSYAPGNTDGKGFWQLSPAATNFGLNLTALAPQGYFYSPSGGAQGTSDFYRKITLTSDTSGILLGNGTIGPRLLVKVQVWWKDKKCPASADYPASGGCRITLQTYLTNWKTN